MDTVNTELIRERVDTIILNVLLEQDRYGYEILELISNKSKGRYAIKQPTLYSCLKRLEKQGFISSYFGDESNGGRRRYYKLTQKGIDTLTRDQKEWEFSRTILDNLLSDKQVDLESVEAPFDPNELRPLTKRVKAYEKDDAPVTQPVVIPITVEARVVNAEPATKPAEREIPAPRLFESAQFNEALNKNKPLTEPKTEPKLSDKVIEEKENIEKVSASEDYRLREQRLAAERLLQIGDFTSPYFNADLTKTEPVIQPEAPRYKSISEVFTDPAPETVPPRGYKEALGAIFKKAEAGILPAEEPEPFAAEPVRVKQFNDLRQTLADEGYKLRSYSKANTANYYHLNYIYFNRIMRDTFLIVYLFVIVELLAVFLARSAFGYKLPTLIGIGGVALALPLASLAVWALNPTKRVKARFNFNSSLINSIIAFIIIAAVSTIISMVAPTLRLSFDDAKMYMPYILAVNIPLAVVVYQLLYKSKNYHLKN